MLGNEIEKDILGTLDYLATNENIKGLANNIADYIYKVGLANTLTPQEMMSLIYLVNGTVNTQVATILGDYIHDFFVKHPNEKDDEEIICWHGGGAGSKVAYGVKCNVSPTGVCYEGCEHLLKNVFPQPPTPPPIPNEKLRPIPIPGFGLLPLDELKMTPEELDSLKARMERLYGLRICPECGHPNRHPDNYCDKCNKYLKPFFISMKCPECGRITRRGNYCDHCKSKIPMCYGVAESVTKDCIDCDYTSECLVEQTGGPEKSPLNWCPNCRYVNPSGVTKCENCGCQLHVAGSDRSPLPDFVGDTEAVTQFQEPPTEKPWENKCGLCGEPIFCYYCRPVPEETEETIRIGREILDEILEDERNKTIRCSTCHGVFPCPTCNKPPAEEPKKGVD